MAIPESQLETWSRQGATTTAKATHESIRNALSATSSPLRSKDFEVYIQGSYKNDTNIRGDSDVDVVVQLNSAFGYDLSPLPSEQQRLFQAAYPTNATYGWEDFRADALQALRNHYGSSSVRDGNKSLKLAAGSGRLAADVVPALQSRKYLYFYNANVCNYIEGICFWTRREGRRIVNFPKQHYDNGVAKNHQQRTNGWYKPAVRVFKNARNCLIDQGVITDSLAPSYFLECLVHNAPDNLFGESYRHGFARIVHHWSTAPFDGATCQNGQLPLFGSSPEQWNTLAARQLIQAFITLWTNW